MAMMTIKQSLRYWKIAEFLLIVVSVAHAGFPWLVSEDEKNSWFSGPSTTTLPTDLDCFSNAVRGPDALNPQFAFLRPRVSCRSVRAECPLVPCADPVTKKGQCCSTCHNEYIALSVASHESSKKHHRRPLGRFHLTISRKSMFTCIKFESHTRRIKFLRLKNKNDDTIYHSINEEKFVTHNDNGKYCLESELPGSQIEDLMKMNKVVVELHLNDSTDLKGVISPYEKFSEVPFVALLSPFQQFLETPHIAAGIASIDTDMYGDEISLKLGMLFKTAQFDSSGHMKQGSVLVKVIKRPWKADKLSPILKTYSFKVTEEEMTSEKLVMKEVKWSRPRPAHLRWVVRGIIFVTIDFKVGSHQSRVFGRVSIHDSCGKFYTVLSGGGLKRPTATATSGFASLSFNTKSRLRVKVSGRGIPKAHKMDINIVDSNDFVMKKLATIKREPEEDNFQATGVWEKPTATAIAMVFKGKLFIKVAAHIKAKDDMRGRVQKSLYMSNADYDKASIVSIHDVDSRANAKTAAVALLTADPQCNINYVIFINGYADSSTAYKSMNALLKLDLVFNKGKGELGEVKLEAFNENFIARGSLVNPSDDFLIGVASGMAHIQIQTHRFTTHELKGHVTLSSNKCAKILNKKSQDYLQRSLAGSDLNAGVCLHQGRFYDDEAEWHPLENDRVTKIYCKKCTCNKRLVTCKHINCPMPLCPNPVKVREHCCPVCTSPPNGRALDPRKACVVGMPSRNEIRAIGEAWHPSIQPFGMIKCIVCICKGAPGNYKCTTVVCPKLDCHSPEKVPGSCCPVCPLKKSLSLEGPRPSTHSTDGLTKWTCEMQAITMHEICKVPWQRWQSAERSLLSTLYL
eukprot:gene1334-15732_t